MAARDTSKFLHDKRLEAVKRRESSRNRATNVRRATDGSALPRVKKKDITFTNPKASSADARIYAPLVSSHAFPEYYVDGKSIPFVNFDVGP